MKFRELKKKKFWMYLSSYIIKDDYGYDEEGESYLVHDENGLILYRYWEYDSDLYPISGYNKENYSWKLLKITLKLKNKYNWIQIWNGKCPRCNCLLTEKNYHVDKYFPAMNFEYDNYYCDNCKQKQVDDAIVWFEKYHEEHKDENPLYI